MDPADAAARSRRRRRIARAAVGVVSVAVALHVAGISGAVLGVFPGICLGLVAFALALLGQRALRVTRAGRFAWTLLLAAHLAFWTARGMQATTLRPPGPVRAAPGLSLRPPRLDGVALDEPSAFRAGVGERPFDLPAGTPIAGWGRGARRAAWPHVRGAGAVGRLSLDLMDGRRSLLVDGTPGTDVLGARALVLRPDRGPPLAICRVDLVVSDERLHAAVAERVSDLGIEPETLLLSATHTHSGPGGFTRVRLACLVGTDHHDPVVFERIAAAAAGAVRAAHAAAVPARLGFVRARDRGADGRPALARNRRGGDDRRDRVDDEVLGLRVDAAEGGRRLALVLNYAVHPTWLRAGSRVFSRDLAGALEESAAIADGATVLFVNGAEGDIAPRVRPAPDAATAIAAFEAAVAKDLAAPADRERVRVDAAVVRRDLGSAHAYVALGGRDRFRPAVASPLGRGLAGAGAAVLALPANLVAWGLGVEDVRAGLTFDGSVGIVAALDSYLSGTEFSFGAVRLATEDGAAAIVWLPAEATHTVGLDLKRRARERGADPVFVFGLTNGAMGYCASHDEYLEGGYEAYCTLFGPEQARLIGECVDAALGGAGFRR